VAFDDTLAKDANTGGIRNILALNMGLAVTEELAATTRGLLSKAD